MRFASILIAVLFAGALLSGCSGKNTTSTSAGPGTSKATLAEGKGAISGLLIDDIYRPIPNCLILLQGAGLTATSDDEGQFQFLDVTPGTYIALASCANHEAAPQNVDVAAAKYQDLELIARRTFSTGGQVLTAEFSAFIPCAADFVVNGVVADCLADSSHDSYRPGFTSKNITGLINVTYMVTEAKMNKVGDYNFQVREDDGSNAGGERYAVATIKGSDYVKIVNQFNVTNTVQNEQQNNVPWKGEKKWATILFIQGQYKDEAQGAGNKTPPNPLIGNPICCGAGAQFGIKAKFLQSIFLGAPATPIEQYCVLAKTCS